MVHLFSDVSLMARETLRDCLSSSRRLGQGGRVVGSIHQAGLGFSSNAASY